MNQLKLEKRAAVVRCLVDGVSVRGTVRITGVAKNTVAKLLVDLGAACEAYHHKNVRGLRCERIQCDETWAFCYAKAKNVPAEKQGEFGVGDVWTWVALDAGTKLTVSWAVGNRDAETARGFMLDVADRVLNRVQLTTDGHIVYLQAVENAFGIDVDYAQLVKVYGPESGESAPERKYSPGKVNGSKKLPQLGLPAREHVSTSFVERGNLTMRMGMRRFTRLTNAFSKKVENHAHAVALHFMHYNYCRVHQTLKMTPAQASGLADHAWTVEELVGLLDSN